MPLYEYEDVRTGERVELRRPLCRRDDCPGHLRRVMARPAFRMGAGALDPTAVDVAAPRGLREMEEQMGSRDFEHNLGMSARKLKEIWSQ